MARKPEARSSRGLESRTLRRGRIAHLIAGEVEADHPATRKAPSLARERDVAVKGICEMSEAQFRQHWIAKVFRNETPSGPKIVYSSEMAIDQVTRTPGAITFVDASHVTKAMKVLKIDGLTAGQAGYKVK